MDYINLGKLYYIDRERYKAEYTSRFSSPDTIHLDFMVKKNQAFFVQTSEVSNLAIQILKTDKKISKISGGRSGDHGAVSHRVYRGDCVLLRHPGGEEGAGGVRV